VTLITSPRPGISQLEILWAGSHGQLLGIDPATGTILVEDNLKGLGYDLITLATSTKRVDQQSSNLLLAPYIFKKCYQNFPSASSNLAAENPPKTQDHFYRPTVK